MGPELFILNEKLLGRIYLCYVSPEVENFLHRMSSFMESSKIKIFPTYLEAFDFIKRESVDSKII